MKMLTVEQDSNESKNWIVLKNRVFTPSDQQIFAELSGDKNPIHISSAYARKTPPGQPIVHGMNAVLWMLETLAECCLQLKTVLSIKFLKPIYLNETVYCRIRKCSSIVEIFSESITHVRITIEGDVFRNFDICHLIDNKVTLKMAEMTIEDIAAEDLFEFKHAVDLLSVQASFPKLSQHMGIELVAQLASLSAVVGMIVPGLHSIFFFP